MASWVGLHSKWQEVGWQVGGAGVYCVGMVGCNGGDRREGVEPFVEAQCFAGHPDQ